MLVGFLKHIRPNSTLNKFENALNYHKVSTYFIQKSDEDNAASIDIRAST
jgi:hypothetical protein